MKEAKKKKKIIARGICHKIFHVFKTMIIFWGGFFFFFYIWESAFPILSKAQFWYLFSSLILQLPSSPNVFHLPFLLQQENWGLQGCPENRRGGLGWCEGSSTQFWWALWLPSYLSEPYSLDSPGGIPNPGPMDWPLLHAVIKGCHFKKRNTKQGSTFSCISTVFYILLKCIIIIVKMKTTNVLRKFCLLLNWRNRDLILDFHGQFMAHPV